MDKEQTLVFTRPIRYGQGSVDRFGRIAQLVEQWPLKPTVAGSNPATPTLDGVHALVAQWIEPRTSKPLMLVRFQPRAQPDKKSSSG